MPRTRSVSSNNKQIIQAATSEIAGRGVGTCGPRGFYGTLDVHLELEQKLADLYDAEACLLYAN